MKFKPILKLIKQFEDDYKVEHCLGESGHYECGEMDIFKTWLEIKLCKHKFPKGWKLCSKCSFVREKL